jgi:Kef-type K+ transport system membrane component KefB
LHETSSGGGNATTVATAWVAMIVLSVFYLVLSRYLFRVLLRRARRDGTLGME